MPFKKGETPKGAIPFVKGQSGNPAGREKGGKTRATIARNWLQVAQTLKNPITNVTESMSQEDIITLALIKEAREGNVNAYKALMDSAYGIASQSLMMTGDFSFQVPAPVVYNTAPPLAHSENEIEDV
jgi:hypothetical protein